MNCNLYFQGLKIIMDLMDFGKNFWILDYGLKAMDLIRIFILLIKKQNNNNCSFRKKQISISYISLKRSYFPFPKVLETDKNKKYLITPFSFYNITA